jgi:hypothetical protein
VKFGTVYQQQRRNVAIYLIYVINIESEQVPSQGQDNMCAPLCTVQLESDCIKSKFSFNYTYIYHVKQSNLYSMGLDPCQGISCNPMRYTIFAGLGLTPSKTVDVYRSDTCSIGHRST